MREELPFGTVTFLFTDIEGSTRLLHALGPDAYAEALAEHRRVLRDAFAAHGGVEVDTQGDAFFVAFSTAPEAVAAALAGHDGLEPGPIRVRMGLHTGEPTVTRRDTSESTFIGAHGSRRSPTAARSCSPRRPRRSSRRPCAISGAIGSRTSPARRRSYQLGTGDFPSLRTPGAVELPTPATRFLGRERDLFDAVSLWLEREPRMLTIVGPGGIGKTRFAIELARLLAEEADGGDDLRAARPAPRPGAHRSPASPSARGVERPTPAAIATRVGERRTHLVLDNVEQLLPGAARLSPRWPRRHRRLPPRHQPRAAAHPGRGESSTSRRCSTDEAVALFLERARACDRTCDIAGTRELCLRLDRSPLALELAAARVKLLAPEQLLERLAHARPAPRHARRRRAPRDAPRDDRLVARPARRPASKRSSPGSPASRRLHPRVGRGSRATPSSTCSARSSTRASSGDARIADGDDDSGCSRRSASSPRTGCSHFQTSRASQRAATPSGCSRSPRAARNVVDDRSPPVNSATARPGRAGRCPRGARLGRRTIRCSRSSS